METWQEEFLHTLVVMESEEELFDKLSGVTTELGFDYCAYGLRTPLPVSRPKTVMFNNYPESWQKQYQEKGYLEIDPTVSHGIHSLSPFIWPEEDLSSADEFWEEAHSHGLCVGWAQSTRDTYGVTGMLTMARSGENLSENELHNKRPQLTWLTQVAHSGMSKYLTSKLLPETEIRLTARETSVLKWTADGKTSAEISEILGISERTVNYHINNVVEKLGTTNKLAAAVRATVLGILS